MVLVTSYVCSTAAIPYRSISEFVILQTLLAKKKEKKKKGLLIQTQYQMYKVYRQITPLPISLLIILIYITYLVQNIPFSSERGNDDQL